MAGPARAAGVSAKSTHCYYYYYYYSRNQKSGTLVSLNSGTRFGKRAASKHLPLLSSNRMASTVELYGLGVLTSKP